jgi:hypothetical protein
MRRVRTTKGNNIQRIKKRRRILGIKNEMTRELKTPREAEK